MSIFLTPSKGFDKIVIQNKKKLNMQFIDINFKERAILSYINDLIKSAFDKKSLSYDKKKITDTALEDLLRSFLNSCEGVVLRTPNNYRLSVGGKYISDFAKRFVAANVLDTKNQAAKTQYEQAVSEVFMGIAKQQYKKNNFTIEQHIDEQEEGEHIVQYLLQNWSGAPSQEMAEVVSKIWQKALKVSEHQMSKDLLFDFVTGWLDFRKNCLNWKSAGCEMSEEQIEKSLLEDKLYLLPRQLLFASMQLERLLSKSSSYGSYVTRVNEIISIVKEEFKSATKLRPNNWKSMLKNYKDYDGIAQIDHQKLAQEFKGSNFQYAGALSFSERVHVAHVAYDYTNQDRKPLEVLVGAILTHAHQVNSKNNEIRMLKEWLKIKNDSECEENFLAPVKKLEYTLEVPHNLALQCYFDTEEELSDEEIERKVKGIFQAQKESLVKKSKPI